MRLPNLTKFLSQTKIEGQCIIWTGARYPKTGYGQCYIGSDRPGVPRYAGAHRVRWMLANGSIPEGICVLHSCDNPSCVRLEHLRLGTVADNQRDMSLRGRSWRGQKHHKATVNEDQVREIRRLWSSHTVTTKRELAERFSTTPSAIYQILSGKSWRHVT